jgi:hypothetical protein
MVFMLVTTMAALVLQVRPFAAALPDLWGGKAVRPDIIISGICGAILLVLGGLSALFAGRALWAYPAQRTAKVPS